MHRDSDIEKHCSILSIISKEMNRDNFYPKLVHFLAVDINILYRTFIKQNQENVGFNLCMLRALYLQTRGHHSNNLLDKLKVLGSLCTK